MINELTVLRSLKKVIETQLNEYIDKSEEKDCVSYIDAKNVVIDFPDPDQMPADVTFFLQPDYCVYEPLSVESDNASFTVMVFICVKRDKQESLTTKLYTYFNALYSLLRNNLSLDQTVDFCDVGQATPYPAVGGNRSVQAIEVAITVRFTKDF